MIARVIGWLQALGHIVDLAIRLYVAQVFFRSGLLKIGNWDGTLYLFENEYRVPLLALGLAARFAAASLSVFNVVAVISFWHVLGQNEAALMSHFYWGVLLLVTLCHGPGILSLDHFVWKRFVGAERAGSWHCW